MSDRAKVRRLLAALLEAPLRKFPPRRGHLEAPDTRGVYIIYGPRNKVCHVGCAPRGRKGIRQRLGNHLQTQSSFTAKYPPLRGNGANLREVYSYRYLEVRNQRLLMLLEAFAVGSLCPAHIGLHQAQA